MKAWNDVVNNVMLGTDKPIIGHAEFPEHVASILTAIDADETVDAATKFLNKAAVLYNYRQCGVVPVQKKDLPESKAEVEVKPYCSHEAASNLNRILEEANVPLLKIWLTYCKKKEQLIWPEVLPWLLTKGEDDGTLRSLLPDCIGNRGIWLSRLNPKWNYLNPASDEDTWQTGKENDRVKVLRKIRTQEPQKALEWLQQTWQQENAASKVELLKILRINQSSVDLPWIENLRNEKAQKVKDEVLTLLTQIPGSSIINEYEALLKKSVVLKKEKSFLGMGSKTSIQLNLPKDLDDSIFKTGIEKLAGPKSKFSDEEYIIYQLISKVPPVFWEKHFDCTPEQVVMYFDKHAGTMIQALGSAVARFREVAWMSLFLNLSGFYVDFIEFLSPPDREKYLLRFMNNDPQTVIQYATRSTEEWGLAFASKAIRYMANHSYPYNRNFYSQQIGSIPLTILPEIEKIDSTDVNAQSAWEKSREHLIKLLNLKRETLQAFNA